MLFRSHGAMRARRRRGIAASRDSTTTGRRPIPGSSHHHTSPRVGVVTTPPWRRGTRRGRPTRRPRQAGTRRTPHSSHRAQRHALVRAELQGPRQGARHHFQAPGTGVLCSDGLRRQWCSHGHVPCHKYATIMASERACPSARVGSGATSPGVAVSGLSDQSFAATWRATVRTHAWMLLWRTPSMGS